jgi:hypothetical protein
MEVAMNVVTSRRTILVGAAALPALSLPAIASVADPDATIKALFKELEAGVAKWHAYVDGPQKEAEVRYDSICPPATDEFSKMPANLLKQIPRYKGDKNRNIDLTAGEYAIMKRLAPKHPVVVWYDQQLKSHMRKWTARHKSAERAREQSGLDAAEKEQARLFDAYLKIYDQIKAAKAHTLAGVQIKVRAAKLVSMEPDESDEWTSISADILSLSAVA